MRTNTDQINIRVQTLVVAVSCMLFVLKLLAFYLTNSVAILTDALESTVNVVTGFTGLYSLRIAALPRDENHPYGHGKAELLSASFEGILILIAGMVIIYESITNLLHPQALHALDAGISLILGTAAANYMLGWYCIRTGKRNHSIALLASGKHLQTDTWSTLGIIIGLLLIRFTGLSWIDSGVAILFGILIIVEGSKIIRQTVAGIMDEADLELLRRLIQVLNSSKSDYWIDLHNLRVIKYGAILHLDCHLTVPWYFNVNEAHAQVDALEQRIRQDFPQSLEMFVHTDGCVPPASCRVCPVQDCPARQAPMEQRLEWTLENITSNLKHGTSEAWQTAPGISMRCV
ncbi:MAG: cation transporter [Saprospirales bacterium]|nr:cation transporter [Saprospirales bacterium]